eukprot:Opistho-2@18591
MSIAFRTFRFLFDAEPRPITAARRPVQLESPTVLTTVRDIFGGHGFPSWLCRSMHTPSDSASSSSKQSAWYQGRRRDPSPPSTKRTSIRTRWGMRPSLACAPGGCPPTAAPDALKDPPSGTAGGKPMPAAGICRRDSGVSDAAAADAVGSDCDCAANTCDACANCRDADPDDPARGPGALPAAGGTSSWKSARPNTADISKSGEAQSSTISVRAHSVHSSSAHDMRTIATVLGALSSRSRGRPRHPMLTSMHVQLSSRTGTLPTEPPACDRTLALRMEPPNPARLHVWLVSVAMWPSMASDRFSWRASSDPANAGSSSDCLDAVDSASPSNIPATSSSSIGGRSCNCGCVDGEPPDAPAPRAGGGVDEDFITRPPCVPCTNPRPIDSGGTAGASAADVVAALARRGDASVW